MTEYERGKLAGLKLALKVACLWYSDEALALRRSRKWRDAQENAARGIAMEIEHKIKKKRGPIVLFDPR